ncbi:pyridoxamine 5'-phosphate oxidase family protein [Gordonia zhaorongruii]|uniref:pyridoxamine 5'-phosphate oxidase family protein n=1 Tax=Gordonia zhaorongruii TaxID=2597659 RepID=UPI001404AE76|nr:pyridoxamine 5'-phosphate oxidase family protein [Gordonia zhaorongruii]
MSAERDGHQRVANHIEDLRGARLDADARRDLLEKQTECTFSFVDAHGAPSAVVLSFVWDQGRFWFTSVSGRVQVRAIERDERVCVVVSGAGADVRGRQMLAVQGRARIHRDLTELDRPLRMLAERLAPRGVARFLELLTSPKRLLIEVEPTGTVATHDSRRLPGDGRGSRRGDAADGVKGRA